MRFMSSSQEIHHDILLPLLFLPLQQLYHKYMWEESAFFIVLLD